MKVALIGSHGTGKTTLVYKLAAALKENDYNVGVVAETASLCPLPINEGSSLESQLWIVSTQIAKELEATNKYDIVVCDRAIIDCYVYTLDLCKRQNKKVPKWMSQLLKEHLPSYDLLFKTKINPSYLKSDGIRSVSLEWQQKIDSLMAKVLKEKKVDHYLLPEEKKIEHMLSLVKKWLK
ncbi:ATP-binding protein [Candidatus Woesearchaeota archaeon]|nr:ATP-binding protein [Candidatus Woesearchaeota archaeon]